jgi:hypothetical protein
MLAFPAPTAWTSPLELTPATEVFVLLQLTANWLITFPFRSRAVAAS